MYINPPTHSLSHTLSLFSHSLSLSFFSLSSLSHDLSFLYLRILLLGWVLLLWKSKNDRLHQAEESYKVNHLLIKKGPDRTDGHEGS